MTTENQKRFRQFLKRAEKFIDKGGEPTTIMIRAIEQLEEAFTPEASPDKTAPAVSSKEVGLKIWTDGSCSGNPGKGGWAYIIVRSNGEEVSVSGGEGLTTNNRMELTAAIKALEAISEGAKAEIFSDSEYVIKGITKWIISWRKNNWRNSSKAEVANKDLWLELGDLADKRKLNWTHVKAHNNDHYNELCDELAKSEWHHGRLLNRPLPLDQT